MRGVHLLRPRARPSNCAPPAKPSWTEPFLACKFAIGGRTITGLTPWNAATMVCDSSELRMLQMEKGLRLRADEPFSRRRKMIPHRLTTPCRMASRWSTNVQVFCLLAESAFCRKALLQNRLRPFLWAPKIKASLHASTYNASPPQRVLPSPRTNRHFARQSC